MGKRRKGMKGTASICRVMPSAALGVCLSKVFRIWPVILGFESMFGAAAVEFLQSWDPEQHLFTVTPQSGSFGAQASFVRADTRIWLLHFNWGSGWWGFITPRKSAGEGRQGGRGQHLVLVLQWNCFKLLKHWGSFLTYFRASFRNCWDVFCSVCVEFSWITEERNFVGLARKVRFIFKKRN